MNTWSRCRRCGAINDHDANLCYLCGASSLMKDCPNCGAEFVNPMDIQCPSCKEPYRQAESAAPNPPDKRNNRNTAEEMIGTRW